MAWSLSSSFRSMSAWKPLLNPRLYINCSASVPIVRKMESRAVLTTAKPISHREATLRMPPRTSGSMLMTMLHHTSSQYR